MLPPLSSRVGRRLPEATGAGDSACPGDERLQLRLAAGSPLDLVVGLIRAWRSISPSRQSVVSSSRMNPSDRIVGASVIRLVAARWYV